MKHTSRSVTQKILGRETSVVRAGSSSGARVHKRDCAGRAMGGRRATVDGGRGTRVADLEKDGVVSASTTQSGANHPKEVGIEGERKENTHKKLGKLY